MTDIFIDLMICVFEIYVFYDFLHDTLENRFENKYTVTAILGLMSIIMYGINQFDKSQINLIGIPILFFSSTMIMFCRNLRNRIFYYLIFYIIMTGMEFVGGILFMTISDTDFLTEEKNPFGNFFLIIITKLLSFVILRFIKLFLNGQNIGVRGKLLKITFLLPITTIFLYTGLFYANIQTEEGKLLLSTGCILLLFCNVLVFYIIEKLTYVMEQNNQYELIQLQNTLNNTYYKTLEEVDVKHKKYSHNLKEYLQTIGGLATKSNSSEIIDILKEMEVEIDSISDTIYTDNSILNALLCEKEIQAQKKGIEFNVMIEPELYLETIKNGDLIVMVGNLLDNAIEAASLCKKQKKIDLKFFESEGNFIVLDIENTYGNRIKKKGDSYLSTKKDAVCHGIGIKSVEEIAERYGGLLFLEQKEDVFINILTLSKSFP